MTYDRVVYSGIVVYAERVIEMKRLICVVVEPSNHMLTTH